MAKDKVCELMKEVVFVRIEPVEPASSEKSKSQPSSGKQMTFGQVLIWMRANQL